MAIVRTQNNGREFKALVTITAGAPILIIPYSSEPIRCDRFSVQVNPSATGEVKIYDDVPLDQYGNPPLAANIASVCGPPKILAPSPAALTPGGEYDADPPEPYQYFDLRQIAIDGSNSGDTVNVYAHLKI